MHTYHSDTIVAIATATGQGSVGIVRLSGPEAQTIGQKMTQTTLQPRFAHFADFYDHLGNVIDQGISLFFKAPHSFTGENVVELQAHGGPIIVNLLLQEAVHLGARIAQPGEFSQRAFLNDKIDLAQAEAISDLINAHSESAAKGAIHSLQGHFSQHIHQLLQALIELRMHIEATIDFPEEEIDFLADAALQQRFSHVATQLENTVAQTQQGVLLQSGINVVIAGKPNAGKSSLLNALSGSDSAIVTDIEGTTRDTLKETIQIQGIPFHIIDTAGLRYSNDIVETEGIKRALNEIKKADHLLVIADVRDTETAPIEQVASEFLQQIPDTLPRTYIHNKIDLLPSKPTKNNQSNHLYISAKTGHGLSELTDYLLQAIGYQQNTESTFTARKRHIDALKRTQTCFEIAKEHLANKDGELVAEELYQAQQALGEITGNFSADDLLGEIFSQFCIGK